MLKKLKHTFVLLCASLTGLVLLAACLLAYNLSRVQLEHRYEEAFESQCQSLSVLLAGSTQLSHSQITQMEQENSVTIFLFDNGQPITIASAQDAALRSGLYAAVMENLVASNPDSEISPGKRYEELVNLNTHFTWDGQEYLGKFISAPSGPRQWYSMVLVKPIMNKSEELLRLQLEYAGIFFGGLLLLVLISWILAKRSVRPVEKAQQQQKDFIAAASHELKSPLAVILSSAELAELDQTSTETGLRNIQNEAKRMSGLVEDLLLLAGTETGKWSIKKTPVNIEDLLVSVYEHYLPVAAQKEQTLTLRLPEDSLPELAVDEDRLTQVISILLSNATSYSPENGEIVLSGYVDKNNLILEVIDHGMGISEQDKEHIFDSFFRSEQDRSDSSHYGLGLAVAKRLVELHEGRIEVSNTENGGATFSVKLPLDR